MNNNRIVVSHINIRLSISLLLMQLLLLEVVAAVSIILFHIILLQFALLRDYVFQNFFFAFCFFILFVFVKTFFTVYILFEWFEQYYEIYPTVLKYRKGIFFRKEEEYPLDYIVLVEVVQGVWGKILNFGTVTLYNRRFQKLIEMYDIHDPMRYGGILHRLLPGTVFREKKVADKIIEEEKEIRGEIFARKGHATIYV